MLFFITFLHIYFLNVGISVVPVVVVDVVERQYLLVKSFIQQQL